MYGGLMTKEFYVMIDWLEGGRVALSVTPHPCQTCHVFPSRLQAEKWALEEGLRKGQEGYGVSICLGTHL